MLLYHSWVHCLFHSYDTNPIHTQAKFLVFESDLMSLFRKYESCLGADTSVKTTTVGTFTRITLTVCCLKHPNIQADHSKTRMLCDAYLGVGSASFIFLQTSGTSLQHKHSLAVSIIPQLPQEQWVIWFQFNRYLLDNPCHNTKIMQSSIYSGTY
jgi:hypothetical protein